MQPTRHPIGRRGANATGGSATGHDGRQANHLCHRQADSENGANLFQGGDGISAAGGWMIYASLVSEHAELVAWRIDQLKAQGFREKAPMRMSTAYWDGKLVELYHQEMAYVSP